MAAMLDHLVVTAPNLKSGVQWVRDTLGATPELGGKHPRMGTHNCLLQLGEQTYLEVISPDPNAPDPGRADGSASISRFRVLHRNWRHGRREPAISSRQCSQPVSLWVLSKR